MKGKCTIITDLTVRRRLESILWQLVTADIISVELVSRRTHSCGTFIESAISSNKVACLILACSKYMHSESIQEYSYRSTRLDAVTVQSMYVQVVHQVLDVLWLSCKLTVLLRDALLTLYIHTDFVCLFYFNTYIIWTRTDTVRNSICLTNVMHRTKKRQSSEV